MKAETALKRLNKVAESSNFANVRNVRLTAAWRLIFDAINKKRNTIRPCYYSGRGRFTTKMDHTIIVREILIEAGIRHTLTNDAPRGSETGNIITLTHIKY